MELPEDIKEMKTFGTSSEYYRLYFQCPHCLARGIARPAGFWLHTWKSQGVRCGGHLWVGSNAHYHCDNYQCDYDSHVVGWRYACEEHEAVDVSLEDLVTAVGITVQLIGITHIAWFKKFMMNMPDTVK